MSATMPPPQTAASTPQRAAVTELALSFKAAMASVRRLRGRDTHRPDELSYAQYSLLFGLADRGELSASELAGLADVSPATATQMLDSLVAAGFVERARSERDRRIVLVSLTARGGELVAARRARYDALWTHALADFSVKELATATAVLKRARAIFDEMAAEVEGT
jgi:MarR family transcriptional regulator, organic hydroperoxide resistance regulator